MIPAIKELHIPKYAMLSAATCVLQDMGEKTITTQVRVDGSIAPDFSRDWEVEFRGERYIMPLRTPQASKENTSLDSTIDLTFHHWAVWQLKRWMFFTLPPVETGTAVPDKYIASVSLTLPDFCDLLAGVLAYYYGDSITIELSEEAKAKASKEPTNVEINHSFIWDVLIKLYELYAVRWQIVPAGDIDRYIIKVGYGGEEVGHVFRYGFEGGLLKVERQVQNDEIRNMLLGRGGEKNLPYRYFKDVDPDNPSFKADPDWIPELANIYFSELRGATFRSYIQGWKARHYGGTVLKDEAYAPWAWELGHTDALFNPVEYVKDDASILRYGPLLGGLDSNEDIYPSIQRVDILNDNPDIGRVDEVVDVEQVTSDDIQASVESDAEQRNVKGGSANTKALEPLSRRVVTITCGELTVPTGMAGTLDPGDITVKFNSPFDGKMVPILINKLAGDDPIEATRKGVYVYKVDGDGKPISTSGIPAGRYYFKIDVELYNRSKAPLNVTASCESPNLVLGGADGRKWGGTFDIWIKNIWQTKKGVAEDGSAIYESDTEYSNRVWGPILGDRLGNEAKVVFSDGALSVSEDYEFTIVAMPVYDKSRAIDGVPSEWRLTLAKSDADYDSIGLFVPSTMRQGRPGDHFFFTGIDMPHQYVVWKEVELDEWKKGQLAEVCDIKPAWVVTLDKIRISEEGEAGAAALVDRLTPGASVRLADSRFILNDNGTAAAYETLYLQSITYTYNEPTSDDAALLPDVEVVLSDKYETTANPVATIQGEVSAISKQIGSLGNIEQIVRAVGDKLYLRKDGIADRSMSPTEFFSLLTSGDFRSGIVGGEGWGFFKDENCNWVLETDKLNVRQDMQVNNLVINQITARGGMIVESAAQLEITRVVRNPDGDFVCYFDQRDGSVANLFVVDDVAYCNRFTADNGELKFYKRRVMAVDEASVTLSDTYRNGAGVPAEGDVIVHFGNYTIPERRYVKVRDVVGGGYERYIEGLDSVNSSGTEYYFVGRMAGTNPYNGRPRFFIGDSKSYIEYVNGELNVKARLNMESTVGEGDRTLGDIVSSAEAAGHTLVIDNQVAGLACDADGAVVGDYPTARCSVWRGSEEVADGVSFTIGESLGVEASIDPFGKVTFSSMTADTASVTVLAEVEAAGVSLSGTISLYKAKPGADGSPAVVYSILPSVGSVVRDVDGKPSEEEVSVTKYKSEGGGGISATDELWCYVRRYVNGEPGAWSLICGPGTMTGTAVLADTDTALEFELRDGTGGRATRLDRQMVRVLTDAANLRVGGVNLLAHTNRGVDGWIVNASADGPMRVEETFVNGVRGIKVTNEARVSNPGWQMIMREIPADLFKKDARYILSFDSASSTDPLIVYPTAALSDSTDALITASPWEYLWSNLSRHSIGLVGAGPGSSPNQHYLAIVIRPGAIWGSFTIGNLKLEEGNIATEWSAAPGDGYDYITQSILDARKESGSFEGGLILATLLRLGFTDADGVYRVRSGISGIADRSSAPAIWMGGDMVDADDNPDNLPPATAMFRHDGTGYVAGNTLRFKENRVEVGDSVELNATGLVLRGNDGGEKLVVHNGSVGDDIAAVSQNTADLYTSSATPIAFSRLDQPGREFGFRGNASVELPIGNMSLRQGDGFSLTLGIQTGVAIPYDVDTAPWLASPYVVVDVLCDGIALDSMRTVTDLDPEWTDEERDGIRVRVFAMRLEVPYDVLVEIGGRYSLRATLSGGGGQTAETHLATATVSMDGAATWRYADQNILGNDGLLSKFGQAAMLVTDSQWAVLVGDYGLRITPSGFQATTNGGDGPNGWRALDITKLYR